MDMSDPDQYRAFEQDADKCAYEAEKHVERSSGSVAGPDADSPLSDFASGFALGRALGAERRQAREWDNLYVSCMEARGYDLAEVKTF